MTEAEWLAGGDPDPLLECVRGFKLLTARKARLFACGWPWPWRWRVSARAFRS